jgi:transcriptional regulator GlxA family with amidase domain
MSIRPLVIDTAISYRDRSSTKRVRVLVQIVLFDQFDPLDVVAPFEVLSAGADASAGALDVRLVGIDAPGIVTSGTRGLTLEATAALDPTRSGVILIPGASGPIAADPDVVATVPVLLARLGETSLPSQILHAMSNPDATIATVCGGSLALAMAGLLVGRHVVTHWQGMDVLDATGAIAVNARVVDDGNVVSAAGVTSGLDLALYLLERFVGPRVAREVEILFQYERRGIVWRPSGVEPVAV